MKIYAEDQVIADISDEDLDAVTGGEMVKVGQAFLEAMIHIGVIIPQNEAGSTRC